MRPVVEHQKSPRKNRSWTFWLNLLDCDDLQTNFVATAPVNPGNRNSTDQGPKLQRTRTYTPSTRQ